MQPYLVVSNNLEHDFLSELPLFSQVMQNMSKVSAKKSKIIKKIYKKIPQVMVTELSALFSLILFLL